MPWFRQMKTLQKFASVRAFVSTTPTSNATSSIANSIEPRVPAVLDWELSPTSLRI
jgi:hypothetical protein